MSSTKFEDNLRRHSNWVIFLGGWTFWILVTMTTYKLQSDAKILGGNQGWEYIFFCRWQSSAPLELVHQPLSSATLLRSSFTTIVSRMFLSSVWLRNRRKRSDESPWSQTLNFMLYLNLLPSPAIRFPNFGLILGDYAQRKNILVQGKVRVP